MAETKLVRIHQEVYDELIQLGDASESVNDIIKQLLKETKKK